MLFTDRATLTFGSGSPKPGTIVGDAIATAMIAGGAQSIIITRHLTSNLSVSARSDEAIDVYSLLTPFRFGDDDLSSHPTWVADIEDCLVKVGQRWRIAAPLISLIFKRS